MNQFSQALGRGLAEGIGVALVKVVLIFIFAILIISALGLFTLGLSIYFYKRKKLRPFLISGFLSTLAISLITSIILSSKFSGNFSLAVILFPVFLIFGTIMVLKFRRKLKNKTS
ncbi:MAG: hypothetical protein Q7S73_00260 [bacterium]|jgi:hypothetical protein|nr:hypothetical protein [bacterium]